MTEQWNELKATITELRDNGGKGTQQEVCGYFVSLMTLLETQMQEPCDDCISRQQAIEVFADAHPLDYNAQSYLAKIKALPPAEPKQKWIPVSDKLPKVGQSVLACDMDGGIFVDWLNENHEWAICEQTWAQMAAWMPLPEAYKER